MHVLAKNKLNYLYISISLINTVFFSTSAYADDYFNIHALDNRSKQQIADIKNLDAFSSKNGQLPGFYSVKIIINNDFVKEMKINFVLSSDNQLLPEITKKELIDFGVKPDASKQFSELNNNDIVLDIENYIPDSKYDFKFNLLELSISIPQIFMNKSVYGYIPPSEWDDGINALMLDYQYNGSKYWNKESSNSDSQFLSLRSGINLSSWQLRNYSTYNRTKTESTWSSINTYIQRSIVPLKSDLVIGEYYTNNQLFDSFGFKGIQLTSDDSMLPASMRGFAPIVRGIAKSSGKVIIKQNNYVIYETYVSAGPFEILDLYPSSSSGDLDIYVEGDDGSEQYFVVPFSSVPILQREGQLKYNITAGKYRANGFNQNEPNFILGTFSYGLPYNITMYTGGILSNNYRSELLGAGLNLGDFGALSLDVTSATAKLNNEEEHTGKSYRIQYAKNMLTSGTTISLANYRFSSKEFYSFDDVNRRNTSKNYNQRSRFQVNINQSLKNYGSLYISSYQQNYWAYKGKEKYTTIGYNNMYNSISYGLSYSNTKSAMNHSEQLFSFNISIPLNIFDHSTRITSSFTQNKKNNSATIGFNGTAMDNAFYYGLQQSFENHNNSNNTSLDMSYESNYGTINTGYYNSDQGSRLNYGFHGGALLYSEGIALSGNIGDTMALVKVDGASDVKISNKTNLKTNSQGLALVPYLSPYQKNNISLEASTLNSNVELKNDSIVVIPKKGAVVVANFKTSIGYRILLTLKNNNLTIPFGTVANLKVNQQGESSEITGIVGYGGKLYMSGMPENGEITIKWGSDEDQTCTAKYSITPDEESSIYNTTAECF